MNTFFYLFRLSIKNRRRRKQTTPEHLAKSMLASGTGAAMLGGVFGVVGAVIGGLVGITAAAFADFQE